MKRLLTLLFFAFFAISSYGQVVPNLPSGTVPFGTGLFRAPDGDIWAGSKFDGYTNLGNWQRVADSLGAKINWSDTTIIASKEWVEGKLNSLPPSGVLTVTGDGVDNTDPANPVISYPDPSDIGALAPGDNISELNDDVGYITSEEDPTVPQHVKDITQNDIDGWDAKQDAITGAASTVVINNLTPSRALISNGSGKIAVSPVSSSELAFLDGASSNIQDQLDAKIPLAQKGASDGVAPLGPDGKVPNNYLNFTGYTPKGSWDASTNTPTLADGAGTIGWVYTVSVAGTQDLGSGSVSYNVGDRVVYTADNIWVKEENTQLVVSVNGYQGVVNLNKADVGLGNVDNTSDLDKPISNAVQDALDLKLDASEISNYYTKTNLQTSGQSQVHWENITNAPGFLLPSDLANYVTTNTNQDIPSTKTFKGSDSPLRLQANTAATYMTFLASDGTRKGYIGFPAASPNDIFINNDTGGLLKIKTGISGLTYNYGDGDKSIWHSGNFTPGNYVTTGTTQTITGAKTFSSPVTGVAAVSANQFVTLSQLQAAETPETVISTTVNFTIDWQTDIAPNSGGKTYAELHGNHFVYSAFYNDGSGAEVNYSPAVKITRSGGNITTVQFGDIQNGNIVIK